MKNRLRGRPRMPGRNRVVRWTIPKWMREELDQLTEADGRSLSQLVRVAIRERNRSSALPLRQRGRTKQTADIGVAIPMQDARELEMEAARRRTSQSAIVSQALQSLLEKPNRN